MWMIKRAWQTIGVTKERGLDKAAFPKFHAWCDSIPTHDDAIQDGQFLTAHEATEQILAAQYACPDIGVDPTDLWGAERVRQCRLKWPMLRLDVIRKRGV